MNTQTNGLESKSKRFSFQSIGRYGTILGLLVLLIIFSLKSDVFLQKQNLLNILSASALLGIISSGLTVAMVLMDFDLSIGYVATLGGMYSAGFSKSHGVLIGFTAGILIGIIVGVVNGLIVTFLNVSPFIATLGIGIILQGIIYSYTGGAQISDGLPDNFSKIGTGEIFGVSDLVWVMGFTMLIIWIMLTQTPLGRKMYAIGGNATAARLAGINVRGVRIAAFAISGATAAITGVCLASNLSAGNPTAALGYMLDAFTACFIGAATLRDGEFHILGTLIGVLILGVLANGLILLGVPPEWQTIIKGSVLIAAVAVSGLLRRRLNGN